MTTAYLIAVSALSCAAGVTLTALHFRSRLNEAKASEARYKAWWERDSGKMIVLQAEADLRRQQHIDAGRQSHKAERALFRETAKKLGEFIANRDNPPATDLEPAAGIPAGAQRPQIMSGSRRNMASFRTGQDTGVGLLPDVTLRASDRNAPVDTCGRNCAGYSAPAEFPQSVKGGI